jgi:hypothetical protein
MLIVCEYWEAGLQFYVGFVESEVGFHFSAVQVLLQCNAVLLSVVHLGLYLVPIDNQGFWYNLSSYCHVLVQQLM